MSNQFFNFYYDPVRQGYDDNTWETISGTPSIASNYLVIDGAEVAHKADILRGDAVFCVNVPAPVAGANMLIGFQEINSESWARFAIIDDVFVANVSTGPIQASEEITWDASWTNADIELRIKWEAGAVYFYVNGVLLSTLGEVAASDNVAPIGIPSIPLNLFLSDTGGGTLLVKYIDVKGIQNFMMQ